MFPHRLTTETHALDYSKFNLLGLVMDTVSPVALR